MPNACEYHDMGFNCCESVLSGLCDYLGEDTKLVPRIATGFGGGVGHTGDICGAVSGAIMALGIKFGRSSADEKEKRDRLYLMVEEFLEHVRKELGSIDCFDLIGIKLNAVDGMKVYRENKLGKKCHRIIEQVDELARKFLERETTP